MRNLKMSVIIKLKASEEMPLDTLQNIAAAIKACKIVVFPTDTVYGMGSTGLVKAAARKIYQNKGRSSLKPLPILVASTQAAKRWVEWTPAADLLARKFWPGALTLVLRPTQEGRLLTFAEYPTVAVRVPNHPLLLKLLAASGIPWASTSANLSGSPALKDGPSAVKQFDQITDYIIDAGPSPGVESTVVDVSHIPIRILREGVLSSEEILEALKQNA